MPSNQHERAKVFERGQVWYWDDPIYQAKQKGLQVEVGVAGLRYSRYVIIAQDPETAGKNMILVVPCTSKDVDPHDIEVPIDHLYKETHGYARVQSIMPVHPRTLINYICRLPDEAMKAIDAEIVKMLNPYIRKNMKESEILARFGINMNVNTKEWYQGEKKDITTYVQMFINQRIQFTFNKQDVVSIQALKDAFDVFCIDKEIYIDCDIVEFLDRLYRQMKTHVNTIGYRNDERHIFDIINFSGIKLKEGSMVIPVASAPLLQGGGVCTLPNAEPAEDPEVVVEEAPIAEPEIKEPAVPEKQPEKVRAVHAALVARKAATKCDGHQNFIWSKEEEIKFLQDWDTMSRDDLAKKYGITRGNLTRKLKEICEKHGYEIKRGHGRMISPVLPEELVPKDQKPFQVPVTQKKTTNREINKEKTAESISVETQKEEPILTDTGSLMRGFIDKRIKWNSMKFTPVDEVYEAYVLFCKERSVNPMTQHDLIKFLESRCISVMANGKNQGMFRFCQLLKDDISDVYDLPEDIKNITRGVQLFCDHISNYLQYNNVYDKMHACTQKTPKEFYKDISGYLFTAILTSLHIQIKYKKYVIPERKVLAEDSDTVWFLTMLYSDQSLNTMYNYDAMCERYKNKYNRTPGISRTFIPFFETKMKYAAITAHYNIEVLSEFIAKRFCRPE